MLQGLLSQILNDPVCVVLAAGLSLRFGSPKQLALFEGESLIHRAVRVAIGARCKRTIAVIPAALPPIRHEIESMPVEIIENQDPQNGMSSSIRLAAAAAGNSPLLLTLGDQPFVTSEHLRRLILTDGSIAATTFNGVTGAPALFHSRFLPMLLELRGDQGARQIIRTYIDEVVAVPLELASVDIDSMKDFEALHERDAS